MKIETTASARVSANIGTTSVSAAERAKNGFSSISKEDMQKPVQDIWQITEDGGIIGEDLEEQLKDENGKEEFQKVLDAANRVIFGDETRFKFKVHEQTGTIMIKIIDNQTNEVLREIPPEKILNVIAGIRELAGIIVDKKA